ncbi:release factor glutamine methyltransferase [Roseibium aquae]|uniref:Release factor glutamine methyltransferase n=1 Tax=Roseibium aquae TaxID=1323746 RepID=A0A916X3T3_9HYPH|nr:peptide chain release factor N(5)-glutamine methyltransferase [Roseibium aquae]GGB61384.1 release factor glutamine methyltransferase [Roseibium aquae]
MTLWDVYRAIRDRFRSAGLPTADLDARVLVSHAARIAPMDLPMRWDETAGHDVKADTDRLADLRLCGVPVGRLVGEREFFGLPFELNAATLEPRPDTELLVETVLEATHESDAFTFADLGTGTGAIAVSILVNRPAAFGLGVDLSETALQCACANAHRHGVGDRLLPVRADFGTPLAPGLDWIISNPPYIPSPVIGSLDESVRVHDPLLALDGGPDGLSAYRRISRQAGQKLRPGGRLLLEIGYDQDVSVSGLLTGQGFTGIEMRRDLSGHPRMIMARLPEP